MRKIKIYIIGTRGFPGVQGGVEKHCEKLYPNLVKSGFDIRVFTRTPYIQKEKKLKEWCGIKFFHLWCPRKKSLEAIVHTFLAVLISIFKRPDILHFHAVGPSLLIPLAKLFKLKVVMTYHGPDYMRKKWGKIAKKFLKIGEFLGIKFADKVIVISKYFKEKLEKKYKRRDLVFIPNGVEIPEVLPPGDILKKYGLSEREYIFTACRFVPEKGLHDLIEAYSRINKSDFHLVIAGDADHETEYSKNLKRKAKETGGVILTGFISGRPLQELYSNARLFVLPSYYEGLPIALLEAMSYGLPVLVSDIPQNREIPLPEYRFFKPGDIDTLAGKMIELFKTGITEDEKIKQIELLKDRYNWEKIAEQTFKVYKSVIAIS